MIGQLLKKLNILVKFYKLIRFSKTKTKKLIIQKLDNFT